MRLLLDESLPWRLANLLVGHDVTSVQRMGWSGVKNGALLQVGVGGSEGQVEEFEFQVSSFDCGMRFDYIPQFQPGEESPPVEVRRQGNIWVANIWSRVGSCT
jgi:hypothetical protein